MPPDLPRNTLIRRVRSSLLIVGLLAIVSACGSANATSNANLDPGSSTTIESTTTSVAPTTTTIRREVAGTQLSPGANTIYVLGDSVTLGAQTQIPLALVGWKLTFDAKESRRVDQGDEVLAANATPIARVLVVHLCTNWGGGDFHAAAAKVMTAAKGVQRVVWVTCVPWLPAVAEADSVIRSLPNEYPNAVVADWAAIAGTAGYTYGDGLHLKTPGAEALATLIATTVGTAPLPQ